MRKVALITGGTRGIGRGIVDALSPEYDIAVVYNTTPPDCVWGVQADLRDPACAHDVIAKVIEKFGRLDVLVNNAGHIAETPVEGPLDLDGYRQTFEVNLFAPMALLTEALPHLNAGASVINISSVNARLPALAAPAYSASKAALETWTKGTAKALGPRGIRVNAIAPGAIERPENPRPQELVDLFLENTALDRLGAPADIGSAVKFLCSEEAAFITGETLTVSGGYRL